MSTPHDTSPGPRHRDDAGAEDRLGTMLRLVEIDACLRHASVEIESSRRTARDLDPMFYQKLADSRRNAA